MIDWEFFNKGLIHILGLEPELDQQHYEIMGEIKKLEDHINQEYKDTSTIQHLMENVRELQLVVNSKDKLIMKLAEQNQKYVDNIKAYRKLLENKEEIP